MDSQLIRLYSRISKNKLSAGLLFISLLAFFAFLSFNINFEEDITRILPKGDRNDITIKALEQLNFSDKISVLIESGSETGREELFTAATIFLDSLHSLSEYIADIQGKVEDEQIDFTFDFIYEHLPLFLNEKDYVSIENKLHPDSIKNAVRAGYNTLISPTGIVARDIILNDPLGLTFIGLEKLKALGIAGNFDLQNGFVTTKEGHLLLLFITPKFSGTETVQNEIFVRRLNELKREINSRFSNEVSLSYFGAPFIAVANAQQIKADIRNTVLISVGLLMVILVFFYRKIYIPLIIFIPAVCGGLFAMAVMYFLKASISAISISIGAVLLGITIDYPLHIITHYREHSDIKTLYRHVTLPVLTSSLTTAAAFLCLLFVHSEVLRDLGVFASISVLVSAMASLVIIPHLYNPQVRIKPNLLDAIAAYPFHKNKILLSFMAVAVILSLFTFSKVRFNNDLAALNFVPEEIQLAANKLEELSGPDSKTIYLAAFGDNKQEVLKENTALHQKLSSLQRAQLITDFSSLGEMVLSEQDQEKKLEQWNTFWNETRVKSTRDNINLAASELNFNPAAFENFHDLITRKPSTLHLEDYKELKALFLEEFFAEKDGFITFSSIVRFDEENRDTLMGLLSGEEVLVVDRKNLNEQFLGRLRDDFKTLINFSFIAVFLLLFVFFKRIELALISMIPIVLTGLVTAAAMYFMGLEFNIFSTIVTTLILGIGIDFSIYMTNGMQHEYTTGTPLLKTYRTSILLAVITTIIALGALVFAEHPALRSISVISIVGILTAALMAFVLYPMVFEFFITGRPRNGKPPAPLGLVISSVASFLYYGFGGIVYSVCGIIFMAVVPVKRKRKEKIYRMFISRFFVSVLNSNIFLKRKLINPYKEHFEKPAIIISNHTSFLDTLSIGLITNRFIFLVNNWVYHSPVFGKVVKLAGYYPVFKGLAGGEAILKGFVEDKYSLIIFPEGTRSKMGVISRFHKGAFYLSQKYSIDIVPIYIHGNPNILPKGDFIIFPGTQTIEIGQRIPAETMQKNDVKTITKDTSVFYKEKFEALRAREEGPDYFRHRIFLTFLYKNREIVKAAKTEFKENKYLYYRINKFISHSSRVLRLGNDLGIWDSMLFLQQPRRKIFAYIENTALRSIAAQNYLLQEGNIFYPEKCDAEADVLLITHAVPSEELKKLLALRKFESIIIVKALTDTIPFFQHVYELLNEDANFVVLTQSKN